MRAQSRNPDIDKNPGLELFFLHALPLDGSMWAEQMQLLPGACYAPTLYPFGDSIGDWAAGCLDLTSGDRLVLVGCSVGGSCALEVAARIPDRVAALVLIGTKAHHRPEPGFHAAALRLLQDEGVEAAWESYWRPLLSRSASNKTANAIKRIAISQARQDLARGISVFHTRPSRVDILENLSCPVLIVTGSEDPAPGCETCARQTDMARDGRLHVIEDCGHYVSMEKPGQLNTVLRELIDELQRPAHP